ncbi:hypothetical protein [Pseudoneobacillus sp. C159]
MKKGFMIGATSLMVIALSGCSTISDLRNKAQTESQSNLIEETAAIEKEQEVSEEPTKVTKGKTEEGPPVGAKEGTLVDKLEETMELYDVVQAEGTYIRQLDGASVEINVDGEVKVFYLLKGFMGYHEGSGISFSYGTNKDGLNFINAIKQ